MENETSQIGHKADTPHRSQAEQQAFFDAVMAKTLQAESHRPPLLHDLRVAGTVVRLSFAGSALESVMMPALAHLEISLVKTPDVTFHVWDSISTDTANVDPPVGWDCLTDRGDIWGFNSSSIRSAFHWIECSLNLLDVPNQTGIFWVRSAETLPYWTKASPFRTLFHWWMEENGGQLIHAAAVGSQDGAVLITGKGGVGKSTTSLSCVLDGMQYVADDYLIVTLDPTPTAHSLYNTAKLNTDQALRLPELEAIASQPAPGEKTVLHLYPHRAAQVVASLPLRALLTPSFANSPATQFVSASSAVLEGATAFTTMSQLPHSGQHTVDFISRLVARLPGLEMRLGSDLPGVPRAIRGLLNQDDKALLAMSSQNGLTPAAFIAPLVTVVIPVYNGARFLPEAVEAVLAQAWPSLEIIVVDDGSTDDIEEVVAQLPTSVRFFRQENAGPAAARNRGIRDASGDYIAFIDVDDLWPEGKLKTAIEMLERSPSLDALTGYAQLMQFDAQAKRYEYSGNPKESFPHYIGAAVYRRRAFERVGLFDPNLKFGEDADWFTRAKEAALQIERLEQVTLIVRRHAANMTRGKSLVELNALRVLKLAIDRRRALTATA
jgi:hypothetical protein